MTNDFSVFWLFLTFFFNPYSRKTTENTSSVSSHNPHQGKTPFRPKLCRFNGNQDKEKGALRSRRENIWNGGRCDYSLELWENTAAPYEREQQAK